MSCSSCVAFRPAGRVERSLRPVGREELAARLPQHGEPTPGRVFGTVGDVRPSVLLLAGVGELLRRRSEVVPRPVGGRVRDSRRVEELLVVDQREVVDEGRHAVDLAPTRRRVPFERVEVVPVEARVVDLVGEIDDLRASGERSHRRAVLVGDVGRGSHCEIGERLLQGAVVAAVEQQLHLDLRMRGVPGRDLRGDRLGLYIGVPVRDRDVDDAPVRRRRLAAAAAGRKNQDGDEHGRHGDDTTRA